MVVRSCLGGGEESMLWKSAILILQFGCNGGIKLLNILTIKL